MKTICSTNEIQAPPERIWDILTDSSNYPEWHPNIWAIDGKVRQGEQLILHIQQNSRRADVKKEVWVWRLRRPHYLAWREKLRVPGLLYIEYHFSIEAINRSRSRLTQEIIYGGLLLPLIGRRLEKQIRHDLQVMEQALKAHAETRHGSSDSFRPAA